MGARQKKPPAAAPLVSCDDIEAQFYDALQHGDIDRLMAVWADDEEIVCVHPGGPRVVGAAAIRATFEAIFSHNPVPATPTQLRKIEAASTVVHSVLERLDVKTDEGPQSAWVIATNVYVKGVLGWRMVAHHASPGGTQAPEDVELLGSTLH
jgi:ketosteroid isomerase-like protein